MKLFSISVALLVVIVITVAVVESKDTELNSVHRCSFNKCPRAVGQQDEGDASGVEE
jgi:hypothetical protein